MRIQLLLLSFILTISLHAQEEEPLGWPRLLETKEGRELTLYQPQLDAVNGNSIEGRMAISAKDDEGELIFGAVWLKAKLATDYESGMVAFLDISIEQTKFPDDIPEDRIDDLKTFLVREMTAWEPKVSIVDLKASMADMEVNGLGVEGLNHEAPVIFYRESDAVLVMIDGEPKFKEDAKGDVSYLVNSPFFIAKEKNGSIYYLRGRDFWYQSESIEAGWKNVDRVPRAINEFAKNNAPE